MMSALLSSVSYAAMITETFVSPSVINSASAVSTSEQITITRPVNSGDNTHAWVGIFLEVDFSGNFTETGSYSMPTGFVEVSGSGTVYTLGGATFRAGYFTKQWETGDNTSTSWIFNGPESHGFNTQSFFFLFLIDNSYDVNVLATGENISGTGNTITNTLVSSGGRIHLAGALAVGSAWTNYNLTDGATLEDIATNSNADAVSLSEELTSGSTNTVGATFVDTYTSAANKFIAGLLVRQGSTPPPPPSGPSINIQHLTPTDVGTSGGSDTITAVNLSNTFEIVNNSRYIGAGPNGSSANIPANDASLLVRLTDTTTLTYDREAGAAGTNRVSASVLEYVGAAGGANEFITRDRRIVTLSASDTFSYTPSGIVDPTKIIPFITGIETNLASVSDHDHLTACTEVNRTTGEITVHGRGGAGTSRIHIVCVEFTGSNWTVHYGHNNSNTADSLVMDVSGSVASWDNAVFFTQFYKGNVSTEFGLADVTWNVRPNANNLNQLNWFHNTNHTGTAGQRYTGYVLEHPNMVVTRFDSINNLAGDVNLDISSAGLTDLATSFVDVKAHTSGGGTAHLRGVKNAYLSSLTNVVEYIHRSGNTLDNRFQIVDLSGLVG